MNGTHASSALQGFPALRRSYLRANRPAALVAALKLASEADDRELRDRDDAIDPSKPHALLERATRTFRWLLSRKYARSAAAARERATAVADAWARAQSVPGFPVDEAAAVEEERAALASAKWYAGRSAAQPARFDSIRACATQSLKVSCRVCADALCTSLPCRCGVVRACDECAEDVARKRQKRLAAARVATMQRGAASNLFFRKRAGGRFREKMLTVTVPHFDRADAIGEVAEACDAFGLDTTVNARLVALRLAWPRFVRRVRYWLRGRARRMRGCTPSDAKSIAFYRLLEWTRGHDGQGHPHFHVYLFAPWLPVVALRRWWAASLADVGAPLPVSCSECADVLEGPPGCCFGRGNGHAVLDLESLDGFSWATLRELIKSGDRKAIEARMGKLSSSTAMDRVIEYAGAWTMSDAFHDQMPDAASIGVQRDLYCALEGRRLAQGSRGFLAPPPRPVCLCCGQSIFAAAVVDPFALDPSDVSSLPYVRGPPDHAADLHPT